MEAFIAGGWHHRNTRMPRMLELQSTGFVREVDLWEPGEFEKDPNFEGILKPHGLGYGAGAYVEVPSGDKLIFSIERAHQKGPFDLQAIDLLNAFLPHLRRAALMTARLNMQRANAMATALGILGLPTAVVGKGGRLLAANDAMTSMLPSVVQDRRARMALVDSGADRLLASAFDRLTHGRFDTVLSIPIIATDVTPPLIFHVVPIRRMAHDIFALAEAILIVTPVDRRAVPAAEMLQGLFDLTPAEARVARKIGTGSTIDAIAESFGVSRETVRSQLKRVLFKTGLSRQAELTALLCNVAVHSGMLNS